MILDTNAVSCLFEGDGALAELLSTSAGHYLPTVVVGEYRYGLERSRLRQLLADLLETLIAKCTVLPVDLATARHYAIIRTELRDQGTPIPENDLWTAALSRQHALTIVSRDRHFDLIPGVIRRAW